MKKGIVIAISALILVLELPSCASLFGAYELRHQINLLELGMSKEVVMKGFQFNPTFISRELVDGVEQETYTYKGIAPKGSFSSYYMLYHRTFREGKLVAINSEEDLVRTEIVSKE